MDSPMDRLIQASLIVVLALFGPFLLGIVLVGVPLGAQRMCERVCESKGAARLSGSSYDCRCEKDGYLVIEVVDDEDENEEEP